MHTYTIAEGEMLVKKAATKSTKLISFRSKFANKVQDKGGGRSPKLTRPQCSVTYDPGDLASPPC